MEVTMPARREPALVRVNIYDECDVDCEAVNLSIEAGDEVEWHSTGDAFVVKFEEGSSPFGKCQFEVSAGKSVKSGPVTPGTPYATFHYTIQSRVNLAMSADPDVNVKR
jgi:plastocyanin